MDSSQKRFAGLLMLAVLGTGCSRGADSDAHPQSAEAMGAGASGGMSSAGRSAASAGSSAVAGMVAGAQPAAGSGAAGKVASSGGGGTGGTGGMAGAGQVAADSGAAAGRVGEAGAAGVAGASVAGHRASEPDKPGGGRACHSTQDWTPQPSDLWISPGGSDANAGTEAQPKQTLTAAIAAWSAGKTIWVTPGTYTHSAAIELDMKATSTAPLRISGVTGGAAPVFDFSSEARSTGNGGQRGFELSGSYVHLRYLEIKKAADNCVYVTGTDNTLEWLTVHECQDTGVQVSNGAASNKILNVDSYLNADPSGENADGFAPKLSIGQNNYFCGTRAYHNADDGYDCWASGDSSPVKFEYCWAFGQPGPTATANGDGNGFKLGSPASRASGGNAPHELIDCYAFHNRSVGFTANGNSSGKITCTGCGEWGNGAAAWSSGTGGKEPQHVGDITNLDVTVEEAIDAPRDAFGDLPDIATL